MRETQCGKLKNRMIFVLVGSWEHKTMKFDEDQAERGCGEKRVWIPPHLEVKAVELLTQTGPSGGAPDGPFGRKIVS